MMIMIFVEVKLTCIAVSSRLPVESEVQVITCSYVLESFFRNKICMYFTFVVNARWNDYNRKL